MDRRTAILAAIIDSSEEAIISKDMSSRVITWNKAAQRMFGYTESDMIGQLIHVLIPEDRRNEEDLILSTLKKGKKIEHFETIGLTKSGKQFHISQTISPVRDETGQVIGASKIVRDITLQKLNEERSRIIHEASQSISAQLDVETILQIVTDTTTKLSTAAFGAFFYNKVDAKGEAYMLYTLSGAPREAFDKFGMPRNTAIFNPTFEGTAIVRSDDITKDPRYGKNAPHHGMPKGHLPVVSYLAVPVISKLGIVIGGLFFGHPSPGRFSGEHETLVKEIADHAAVALDNAMLYQEINLLNSKKDQFIGFASHELKTPLTVIKGYVQMATINHTPLEEFLPPIQKQVARLEQLIDDLLDLSRIQAGKLDFHFDRKSILQLVKESAELVDLDTHTLKIEVPSEDVLACIDYQKMSQVLVNLLSNAVKYSARGTPITITALVLGDQVHISVSDEGIGIPEWELKQIFNEFYRIASSEKGIKGIGLGLYIAREIMEAHQGKIWAESKVNQGSTFHILFPIERHRNMEKPA